MSFMGSIPKRDVLCIPERTKYIELDDDDDDNDDGDDDDDDTNRDREILFTHRFCNTSQRMDMT